MRDKRACENSQLFHFVYSSLPHHRIASQQRGKKRNPSINDTVLRTEQAGRHARVLCWYSSDMYILYTNHPSSVHTRRLLSVLMTDDWLNRNKRLRRATQSLRRRWTFKQKRDSSIEAEIEEEKKRLNRRWLVYELLDTETRLFSSWHQALFCQT